MHDFESFYDNWWLSIGIPNIKLILNDYDYYKKNYANNYFS